MKRKISFIAFCLCLICMLPITAHATFLDGSGITQHVADRADLLTDREQTELDEIARDLSETYDCDVLIALVEDLEGYTAGDYASALNGGYWWDSEDGVLFLLAMEEREWYIATFGEAIYIFTDYGIDIIGETVVPYLSYGEYYQGFACYLDMLPRYFDAWEADVPVDDYGYDPGYREDVVYHSDSRYRKSFGDVILVSLLIGVGVAAVGILAMRASMNTKRRQHSAEDYLKSGSFRMGIHRDLFLYSNVSKTRRQQNTGTSGGGSSVHRSSGGRSHGGRGGSF